MNNLTDQERERLAEWAGGEKRAIPCLKPIVHYWVFMVSNGKAKYHAGQKDWLNPNNPDAFCYQVHEILLPKVREMSWAEQNEFVVNMESSVGENNDLFYPVCLMTAPPITIARAILDLIEDEG